MVLKGFKFGMLLQLSIGPVCIFIFNEGCNRGFLSAEAGVLAVALVDAVYVLLAIQGIARLLEDKRIQRILMLFGAVIVGIFGLNIIGETVGISVLPNLSLFRGVMSGNAFVTGLVLTASNPLTILFWAGVFSAKVAEAQMRRNEVYRFGLGTVAATVVFMTFIAFAGNFTERFLPGQIISLLNLGVGIVLVLFAVKMGLKARRSSETEPGP